MLLNSKEILERTGLSRATLNNYISWGIVPKPEILPPGPDDGAAPRIGYFPEEVLLRIAEIQRMKSEGWSMTRIAEHFGAGEPSRAEIEPTPPVRTPLRSIETTQGALPRVSLREISHPAYMVNERLEISWFNDAAVRAGILADSARMPAAGEPASVLKHLLQIRSADEASRTEILRFHLGLAKQRGSEFSAVCGELPQQSKGALQHLFDRSQPSEFALVSSTPIPGPIGAAARVRLYAVQFTEGILFAYVPGQETADDLLTLLAQRDFVIADLARNRLPALTQLAVLVTELQHSMVICAELPAEEYFELINQIWVTVDPIFKRHYGTQGKHAGDGMVCYFFPQHGGSHLWNALAAAQETREAMRRLSKEWQLRKGWSTELYLNTGVSEGQEWIGSFQCARHVELTVLGDTPDHAARISEFARCGAVWATKSLVAKLSAEERQRLKYGVRRKDSEGQELFISSVFSRLDSLGAVMDRSGKLKDVALPPVTEVVEIAASSERSDQHRR